MKLVFLFLSLFALMSCNRDNSSSSSSKSVTTAAAANAVQGSLSIMSNCQASSGVVALAYSGQQYAFTQQTVQNGGSFNFTGLANGSYTLYSQAGVCNFNSPITVPGYIYQVCLGACTGSGKLTSSESTKAAPNFFANLSEGPPCQWGVYGCAGSMYLGTGSILVAESKIRLSAKNASSFVLDLEFSSGNNAVSSAPALTLGGWDVKVAAGENSVLTYGAQVNEGAVQLADGFCDKQENLISRMSDYLKISGFSAASVSEFSSRWTSHLAPNAESCVYPQGEEQIAKAVNYKTSGALQARRLWFVVVPKQEAAVAKIHPIPKSFAAFSANPKLDAFKEAKKAPKTRSIANDSDLLAEEIGVAFLIER